MTTTRRTVLQTAALATTMLATPVRARGACRRQAERRVLGSLGARRQRAARKALPGMGREGKGRPHGRFHHLERRQGSADRRRRGAGQDRTRHHAASRPGTRRAMPTSLEPVDDVMATLIQQHGPVSAGAEYLGKQDGHWVAVPTSFGSTLSPPCARIDLMKQLVGLDVTKMYPAGAPPDKELAGRSGPGSSSTQAAEKCSKGGLSVRHAAQHLQRRGAMGRRDVQQPRRAAGRRQGRDHGQQRRDPDRAGMVQEDRAVLPAERLCLGRRLEQQGADLGAKRADLQRALGLGGGEARRAEDRRAAVDVSAAEGSEGPARFRPLPLLGHLEFLAEQGGGEKPAALSVEQGCDREAAGRRARASTCRRSRS